MDFTRDALISLAFSSLTEAKDDNFNFIDLLGKAFQQSRSFS